MSEAKEPSPLLAVRSNAGLGYKCPNCSGMCSVRKFADFENGYWMDCPTCKGTGRVDAETIDRINKFWA